MWSRFSRRLDCDLQHAQWAQHINQVRNQIEFGRCEIARKFCTRLYRIVHQCTLQLPNPSHALVGRSPPGIVCPRYPQHLDVLARVLWRLQLSTLFHLLLVFLLNWNPCHPSLQPCLWFLPLRVCQLRLHLLPPKLQLTALKNIPLFRWHAKRGCHRWASFNESFCVLWFWCNVLHTQVQHMCYTRQPIKPSQLFTSLSYVCTLIRSDGG